MKTLQASSSLLHKPAKRRSYEGAFKRHLVELTLVPGASVARIALDHRINANILFRWRRYYLRQLAQSRTKLAGALLPVKVAEREEAGELVTGQGLRTGSQRRQLRANAHGGVIEVDLPLGRVRLTGKVELEALRVVLEVLSQR